jgi:hypothetical protein
MTDVILIDWILPCGQLSDFIVTKNFTLIFLLRVKHVQEAFQLLPCMLGLQCASICKYPILDVSDVTVYQLII